MLTLAPPDPPTVDLHIPYRPLVLATGSGSLSAARAAWPAPRPPPTARPFPSPSDRSPTMPHVTAMERLRAIQASGYRCEYSVDGRACPYPAGLAARDGDRVLALCFRHYPIYQEVTR